MRLRVIYSRRSIIRERLDSRVLTYIYMCITFFVHDNKNSIYFQIRRTFSNRFKVLDVSLVGIVTNDIFS